MKVFGFLFLAICLFHFHVNGQIITLNDKKIVLKNVSAKTVKNHSFKSSLKDLTPATITKIHSVTILRLLNGKQVVLKDIGKGDDTDIKTYSLKGLLRDRFYVILAKYYDAGEYLVIDKRTGSEARLWGEPYISQDGSYIASFSGSLDYDMMPNGIQLFKVDNDKIIREWEYKITDWQPEDISWKDNKTFLIKKIVPDYISPTKKQIKSYLELSF
jgi:hypothetical protein